MIFKRYPAQYLLKSVLFLGLNGRSFLYTGIMGITSVGAFANPFVDVMEAMFFRDLYSQKGHVPIKKSQISCNMRDQLTHETMLMRVRPSIQDLGNAF